MKKLGIIGGLGPMASAYFFEKITEMTDAENDQQHIEVLIHSYPSVPDRTGFILGEIEESPLPDLIRIGKGLVNSGAEIIAMPCITAQFFDGELAKELKVPLINGIEETTTYLKARGINSAGLMATDGTIKTALFQKSLENAGIKCVLPDSDHQKSVMNIIYNQVKKGKEIDFDEFQSVVNFLKESGAQTVILGCTELSIVKRNYKMPAGIIDVIDIMSRASVMNCGQLKKEFEELITK